MPSESLNQDSFKYQVSSGGQTAIGTVFFTMNTGGQCSQIPIPQNIPLPEPTYEPVILIANNDNYTDVCTGPINSNVLNNDRGLSSNRNVMLIESPKYADTFTLNSDGSFNYKSIMMPSESLNQDSFKYQVSSGGQTAIGTVFFTMNTGGQCSKIDIPEAPFIPPVANPFISISSITPTTAVLNQSTVFTVNGTALPSTLAMWIDNCENIVSLGGSSSSMQFSCTPSWHAGSQNGIVKDKSGGNLLKSFSVTFENPTPTTAPITTHTPTSAPVTSNNQNINLNFEQYSTSTLSNIDNFSVKFGTPTIESNYNGNLGNSLLLDNQLSALYEQIQLKLGNNYSTYNISFDMYSNNDNLDDFTLLFDTPEVRSIYFRKDGTLRGFPLNLSGTYPLNSWFHTDININLINNTLIFKINGQSIFTTDFTTSGNDIESIRFNAVKNVKVAIDNLIITN